LIPEGPFLLFAVGAANLSLAGLAGLVATLRRGGDGGFEALDRFRLREIVEFAFANALIALVLVPTATTVGSMEWSVRVLSAAVIVYQVLVVTVLVRRQLARGIPIGMRWASIVTFVNVIIFVAALAGVLRGATSAYEWLLLALLARPMLAFLAVLVSFERPATVSAD